MSNVGFAGSPFVSKLAASQNMCTSLPLSSNMQSRSSQRSGSSAADVDGVPGGTTPVWSLKTIEKPCEKYSALPLVSSGLSLGHISFWPASERRYWMMVPRLAASSTSKSVSPGFQPSLTASL